MKVSNGLTLCGVAFTLRSVRTEKERNPRP
nr:MAG TPA: hypothetical protein [Caudoviricetes sp.]